MGRIKTGSVREEIEELEMELPPIDGPDGQGKPEPQIRYNKMQQRIELKLYLLFYSKEDPQSASLEQFLVLFLTNIFHLLDIGSIRNLKNTSSRLRKKVTQRILPEKKVVIEITAETRGKHKPICPFQGIQVKVKIILQLTIIDRRRRKLNASQEYVILIRWLKIYEKI